MCFYWLVSKTLLLTKSFELLVFVEFHPSWSETDHFPSHTGMPGMILKSFSPRYRNTLLPPQKKTSVIFWKARNLFHILTSLHFRKVGFSNLKKTFVSPNMYVTFPIVLTFSTEPGSWWWFHAFFYVHPYLGEDSQFWLIFFKGVETTNQFSTEPGLLERKSLVNHQLVFYEVTPQDFAENGSFELPKERLRRENLRRNKILQQSDIRKPAPPPMKYRRNPRVSWG